MEGSIDRIGNMVKCEVIEEKVYVKVMKLWCLYVVMQNWERACDDENECVMFKCGLWCF